MLCDWNFVDEGWGYSDCLMQPNWMYCVEYWLPVLLLDDGRYVWADPILNSMSYFVWEESHSLSVGYFSLSFVWWWGYIDYPIVIIFWPNWSSWRWLICFMETVASSLSLLFHLRLSQFCVWWWCWFTMHDTWKDAAKGGVLGDYFVGYVGLNIYYYYLCKPWLILYCKSY